MQEGTKERQEDCVWCQELHGLNLDMCQTQRAKSETRTFINCVECSMRCPVELGALTQVTASRCRGEQAQGVVDECGGCDAAWFVGRGGHCEVVDGIESGRNWWKGKKRSVKYFSLELLAKRALCTIDRAFEI